MSGGWFITGTDTGVGKTRIACQLLRALQRDGLRAVGMKPIASGCEATDAGWRNDDAVKLMAASSVPVEYAELNPYALKSACAPSIAAHEMGIEIRLETLLDGFHALLRKSPWVVVEGVGGWLAPLSSDLTVRDLAVAYRLPVILVVGLRLGCLNHALLTVDSIQKSGLTLSGWVANQIDPSMTHLQENIAALERLIHAPLLMYSPFDGKVTDSGGKSDFTSETIRSLTR